MRASTDWPRPERVDEDAAGDYLIAMRKAAGVTVRDLLLTSDPAHRITGGVACRNAERVVLRDCGLREFRWCGLLLSHCRDIEVADCRFENASVEQAGHWGGLIRTRWLKDSRVHGCRILSDTGGGYGYKGGGHEGVRFDHNVVDVSGGFSIESPHENEFGLEIDHNRLSGCVSVPKGGQGADPTERGYEHSVHIHHNVLTDSYTVEGPRNHLRVDHNYIHVEKPNGRIYTQHGGVNRGPVLIDHNVVENVDRSFFYMNEGLAADVRLYNNTVVTADAGGRSGTVLNAWSAERMGTWDFRNNVVVCAWSRPRTLMPAKNGVPSKITATGNLLVNVTDPPPGNFVDVEPGFTRSGGKPGPFYHPASAEAFVVDRGVDVGLPFAGAAPDLGAFEWGDPWDLGDVPE